MKKSIGATVLPTTAPVWVVGSYDQQGRPNVATIAWGGICCSDPPCIAISMRKSLYSYNNIMARKAFTVSVPSVRHVKAADYFGLVSGRKVDKLAHAGLTAVASDLVDAPYVAEFPIVIECQLRQTVELGSHTQFIGQVMDIKIEDALLGPDGEPDVEKMGLFVFADVYRHVGGLVAQPFSVGRE